MTEHGKQNRPGHLDPKISPSATTHPNGRVGDNLGRASLAASRGFAPLERSPMARQELGPRAEQPARSGVPMHQANMSADGELNAARPRDHDARFWCENRHAGVTYAAVRPLGRSL